MSSQQKAEALSATTPDIPDTQKVPCFGELTANHLVDQCESYFCGAQSKFALKYFSKNQTKIKKVEKCLTRVLIL